MMTAPVPKAIRPMAALVAASPNMNVPLKCRSPGPKAIQLLIAPKQTKMLRPIRYCTARSHCGVPAGKSPLSLAWPSNCMKMATPARTKANPTQSTSHDGPCRLDGPPGIGSRPAPIAKKNAPVIIATVAAKYLLAGVAGFGSSIGQPRGNLASATGLPRQHCDLIKQTAQDGYRPETRR